MFFGMLQFTYWGLLEPGFTSNARTSMTIFFTTLTAILVSLWCFISFTDPTSSAGRIDVPKEKPGVPSLPLCEIKKKSTLFTACIEIIV